MDVIKFFAVAAILIVVVKYYCRALVTRTLNACGSGKLRALGGMLSILEIGSVILLIAEWHLADAAINGVTFYFLVPFLIQKLRAWAGKRAEENERREAAKQPWEV